MFGTLAIVSADNLGSLALGGFKESCTSLKMCRHCMAEKGEAQTQVCGIYYFNAISTTNISTYLAHMHVLKYCNTFQSIIVTGFVKRGLPHTSNLRTLAIHNVRLEKFIALKFGQ